MVAVLGRSDFRFADLKRRNASVFLVLPPDRLATYSRWLRLLVSQSLIDMARDLAKPAAPVLYLLDEFAAPGHLAPVERAMGLMAGYGDQLWPSCKTFTSSAPPTGSAPAPSCQTPASYRCSASTITTAPGLSPISTLR